MKKEDWTKVDEALKMQDSPVELLCDGYKVTLRLTQISQFKLAIGVYVNGWFRGEWFATGNPSEEGRRFFPSHYINCYSAKEKRAWSKVGKKFMKECGINLKERREYKGFYWTSFSALKRHFIANNESIELL